ncbi:MAG: hypothetical protein ACOYN4_18560 [Bacteroidales bacterium]
MMENKLKYVNCHKNCQRVDKAIFQAISGIRFLISDPICKPTNPIVRGCIIILVALLYVAGFSQNAENIIVTTVKPASKDIPGLNDNCEKARKKPHLIAKLPPKLKETSGLVMFDGLLWTINDGGNPAEIYQIDTANGQVLRTVKITKTPNYDWESLTQDDSNVYIGDFGNNSGNRTNLQILKISKQELRQSSITETEAQFIRFRYPDQADFTPNFNKNNFDCEAFFFFNDSLHLFTKNWDDGQSKHYTLPNNNGTYEANLKGEFDADGLITDASINQKGNIILLGYKNTSGKFYTSFAWLFAANNGNISLEVNKRRLEFGSVLRVGQTEGIYLKNDDSAFISAESILNGWLLRPAKLLHFDLDACFPEK